MFSIRQVSTLLKVTDSVLGNPDLCITYRGRHYCFRFIILYNSIVRHRSQRASLKENEILKAAGREPSFLFISKHQLSGQQ